MRGGLSHPPPPCHRPPPPATIPLPLQSNLQDAEDGLVRSHGTQGPLLLCAFKDVAETSLRRWTGRETRLEPKKPLPSAPSSHHTLN